MNNDRILRAVGELAIIIVGVLVALAVDEWRQDRAQAEESERYLTAITADLAGDSGRFAVANEVARQQAGAAWYLDSLVSAGGAGPDPERVARAVQTLGSSNVTIRVQRGGYDALVGSGGIALLPVDLQAHLSRYYETLPRTTRLIDDAQNSPTLAPPPVVLNSSFAEVVSAALSRYADAPIEDVLESPLEPTDVERLLGELRRDPDAVRAWLRSRALSSSRAAALLSGARARTIEPLLADLRRPRD